MSKNTRYNFKTIQRLKISEIDKQFARNYYQVLKQKNPREFKYSEIIIEFEPIKALPKNNWIISYFADGKRIAQKFRIKPGVRESDFF